MSSDDAAPEHDTGAFAMLAFAPLITMLTVHGYFFVCVCTNR